MRSPILRVALAASWQGRSAQRVRAIPLLIGAAVVTWMILGCLSASAASQRIQTRATDRAFQAADVSDKVSLERSALFDETANGDQIFVYWWRVVDPRARIPGVPANPTPGSWFVSPALKERFKIEPDLAARFANARTIGSEGVAHRGELLAYRFVGPQLKLDEGLVDRPATDWIGDGGEEVDAFPIAVAAICLVGVPGLGLILAALAPLAEGLRGRLLLLHALGAASGTRRRIAWLQAILVSLPGVMVASFVWYFVAPRLSSVPLVGRAVFPGDLALSVSKIVASSMAVLGLIAVVSSIRLPAITVTRPVKRNTKRATPFLILPAVCGLMVMAFGTVAPGRSGAKLFLVGVVAATVGVVFALPYLLDRFGMWLASGGSVVSMLVGRRMSWNSTDAARSLLSIGALTVLLPLIGSWVIAARSPDPVTKSHSNLVELRGQIDEADVASLTEGAESGVLSLVASRSSGGDDLKLVGDCEALSLSIRFVHCDKQGFVLSPTDGVNGLERIPGVAEAPMGADLVSTLFFARDAQNLERVLRSYVVNGSEGHRQVVVPSRASFHESPLVHWILGATALAGLVGALALAFHLAGNAARLAPSKALLRALGCPIALSRKMALAEAALPVLAVGLAGTAIGWVACWLFVQRDPSASIPYVVLVVVIIGVFAAGSVSGIAAALSIRSRGWREFSR